MLQLWKPLLMLKDKNNPVIFDEIGLKIPDYKGFRPFVIFYDENEDCYYYLRARDAWRKNFKSGERELKKPYNSEVFVKASEFIGLLSKDSLIDCSQIFKCNRELLESLVDFDNDIYKDTRILPKFYISEIKDKIKECIFEVPPNLSIVDVMMDDKGNTYGESLYISDNKLNDYANDFDEYDEINTNIFLEQLISTKSHYSSWSNQRYNNGINFCKMFLNEYFSNELEDFTKEQELNNSKGKEL